MYRREYYPIDDQINRGQILFGKPIPEKNINGGFADILIPDQRGNPLVVVETKKQINGGYRRGIDPYSPEVIKQAHAYASQLGADYFATFNGRLLVLFETFESGVPLLQRKSRAYRIKELASFASSFLDEVAAVQSKKLRWDPADRAFVERLASFHERLKSSLAGAIPDTYMEKVTAWSTAQGWDVSGEEAIQRYAAQAAYLTMNKIVFYKILRDQGEYDLKPLHISQTGDLRRTLEEAYQEVIDRIDFQPIFVHLWF